MNAQKIYMLNSTGRVCFPFPWESKFAPCPWNKDTHQRVLIPLNESEKKNSNKKVHTQIVRNNKITALSQPKFHLRHTASVEVSSAQV